MAAQVAQQRRSLVCGPDRRAPATGAGLARGRLLASFSFREQEQVSWRSVFLLRFPAFSQKEQNGPFFTFSWLFQTFLKALCLLLARRGRASV